MVADNKRYTQNNNQNFQKKMKTVKIKNKHNMQSVKLYEAESIEEKVRRIVNETNQSKTEHLLSFKRESTE